MSKSKSVDGSRACDGYPSSVVVDGFQSPFCVDDPYSTPEYAAFVESMAKHCRCTRSCLCDGVLAGGMCDEIIEDDYDEWNDREDPWDDELDG